jgi:hypothetical protein
VLLCATGGWKERENIVNTFIEFFVWFFVISAVAGCTLKVLQLLLAPGGIEKPRDRRAAMPGRPIYRCGGHVHRSEKAMVNCRDAWPVPVPRHDPAKPCAKCGRNHYAPTCPRGHRATDARTGEVVGYWTPKP